MPAEIRGRQEPAARLRKQKNLMLRFPRPRFSRSPLNRNRQSLNPKMLRNLQNRRQMQIYRQTQTPRQIPTHIQIQLIQKKTQTRRKPQRQQSLQSRRRSPRKLPLPPPSCIWGREVCGSYPYSGDGYDLPADLILVTHGHYDHNGLDLVQSRNEDCRIITQNEALAGGEHQSFDLGYVRVEAVEAGYNQNHDVKACVGYVLTFSNGRSVYVTGDTSTTQQMPLLAEKEIDYAFFCCDGVYNMDAAEASKCAEMVSAKHNLPYHTSAKNDGYNFDRDVAEQFEADNRIILAPGSKIWPIYLIHLSVTVGSS